VKIYPDQIAPEVKRLDTLLLWKYFKRPDGKITKSPVSKTGLRMGYNNPDVLVPFESAKERLSKGNDLGIGISLLDGMEVSVGNDSGYLWCLDFDGFVNPESNQVDNGVNDFISTFNSYTEISPSGTGFKFFFVCDRKPQSKYKIKFGPSEFSKNHPNITKYSQREIEVFSCNGFLALTGDLFHSLTGDIKFLPTAEFDSMLEVLNKWAIKSGGSGTTELADLTNNVTSSSNNRSYCRLIKSSLEDVLAHVDHFDEQVWTDVANVLARVYGEEGRPYFHSYSSGVYAGVLYSDYDKEECNSRFDRALRELESRSDGYGIKHLIKLAEINPDWDNPKLFFEEKNPFEQVSSAFDYKETGSKQNILATFDESSIGPNLTPLERLNRYSLTGKSEELKKQMLEDVFVLDEIAILGQWTAIFASPNTGKTLITLFLLRKQIKEGRIDGQKVFYINADDHYKGVTEKLEIAEDIGMHLLVPGHEDFSSSDIFTLMNDFVEKDDAKNVVIILDTLKKFTDPMDKREARAFGIKAREFVSVGGTLIVLAHNNKHKGDDGRGIYAGTSDIVDDADCAFGIDKVAESDVFLGKKITVEFTNTKSRGNVASTVGFTYIKKDHSYADLLDSVEKLDETKLKLSKQEIELKESLERDKHIISEVRQAIIDGFDKKNILIKEVVKRTCESSRKVRAVIEERAGNDFASGDRWSFSKAEKNAQIFSVLPIPLKTK
jgi:hypothetical protein